MERTLKTDSVKKIAGVTVCLASMLGYGVPARAQNYGSVRGSIVDPSGGVIVGAMVEIQNSGLALYAPDENGRSGKLFLC
jgi:hypothetical protein